MKICLLSLLVSFCSLVACIAEVKLPFAPSIAKAKKAMAGAHEYERIYAHGLGDYREYPDLFAKVSSVDAASDPVALRIRGEIVLGGHVRDEAQRDCIPYLQKAVKLGDGSAAAVLSRLYLHGFIVDRDFAIARELAELSVERGALAGYRYLISIYQYGLGVERSEKKVAELKESMISNCLKAYEALDYGGTLTLMSYLCEINEHRLAGKLSSSFSKAGSNEAMFLECQLALMHKDRDKLGRYSKRLWNGGVLTALNFTMLSASNADLVKSEEFADMLDLVEVHGPYAIQYCRIVRQLAKSGGKIGKHEWMHEAFMKAAIAGQERYLQHYMMVVGATGTNSWPIGKETQVFRALSLLGKEDYYMPLLSCLNSLADEQSIAEARDWVAYLEATDYKDTREGAQLLMKKFSTNSADYEETVEKLYKDGNAHGIGEKMRLAKRKYDETGSAADRDELIRLFLESANSDEERRAEMYYYVADLYIEAGNEYGAQALEYLEKSAELEYEAALFRLARIYEKPKNSAELDIGGKRDVKLSKQYAERAAKLKYPAAMHYLAKKYEDGAEGYKKSLKTACSWYQKSAKQGDAFGLAMMGYFLDARPGNEERNKAAGGADMAKSISYYEQSANLGNSFGSFQLGRIYIDGAPGVEIDLQAAAKWFGLGASQGDARGAGAYFASFYEPSDSGPLKERNAAVGGADVEKAIKYYSAAGEAGSSWACYRLAKVYLNGLASGEKELKLAHDWFEKGAKLGDKSSMGMYASFYNPIDRDWAKEWNSVVGGADAVKAIHWYQKAAEAGNVWANSQLGDLYSYASEGFEKDLRKGFDYYSKAAAAGDAYSNHCLGCFYLPNNEYWAIERNAVVGGADMKKAEEYLLKAAEAGRGSCYNVLGGSHVSEFFGADSSFDKAVSYFKKAIELKCYDAYGSLAWLYVLNNDDYKAAMSLIEKCQKVGEDDNWQSDYYKILYHGSAQSNPYYDPAKALEGYKQTISKNEKKRKEHGYHSSKRHIAHMYRLGVHPEGKNWEKAQEIYLEIQDVSAMAKRWADAYPNWAGMEEDKY
ncbi:tetratricopeptide repeat protein [Persicirhabdus sediminis]|uniref:Sel1 repeat family protein n=1 Tax=Persicirhabdus sediminis TaxID=454144 RepID=A0A8J7MD84_9BACT|nr:tetratricopeptide repeat protein [Persicirhabdus sediminis]MBK1790432.1 sel1 repeat family protein [Persicirhabdus sediminis]